MASIDVSLQEQSTALNDPSRTATAVVRKTCPEHRCTPRRARAPTTPAPRGAIVQTDKTLQCARAGPPPDEETNGSGANDISSSSPALLSTTLPSSTGSDATREVVDTALGQSHKSADVNVTDIVSPPALLAQLPHNEVSEAPPVVVTSLFPAETSHPGQAEKTAPRSAKTIVSSKAARGAKSAKRKAPTSAEAPADAATVSAATEEQPRRRRKTKRKSSGAPRGNATERKGRTAASRSDPPPSATLPRYVDPERAEKNGGLPTDDRAFPRPTPSPPPQSAFVPLGTGGGRHASSVSKPRRSSPHTSVDPPPHLDSGAASLHTTTPVRAASSLSVTPRDPARNLGPLLSTDARQCARSLSTHRADHSVVSSLAATQLTSGGGETIDPAAVVETQGHTSNTSPAPRPELRTPTHSHESSVRARTPPSALKRVHPPDTDSETQLPRPVVKKPPSHLPKRTSGGFDVEDRRGYSSPPESDVARVLSTPDAAMRRDVDANLRSFATSHTSTPAVRELAAASHPSPAVPVPSLPPPFVSSPSQPPRHVPVEAAKGLESSNVNKRANRSQQPSAKDSTHVRTSAIPPLAPKPAEAHHAAQHGPMKPTGVASAPIDVWGTAYAFELTPHVAWRADSVFFSILNATQPVGRDDMFLFYAAEVKLDPGVAARAATVKVFRPDVMGVVAEADYFAQMECQFVAEYVGRVWEKQMAKSSGSAIFSTASWRPFMLMSVMPLLQTRRKLVCLDVASVGEGRAKCCHEGDPTGDLSFFSRTTSDTESLLCIVELGTFNGFPSSPSTTPRVPLATGTVTPRQTQGSVPQSQTHMTPRGAGVVVKSRPGATPRGPTTPRDGSTAASKTSSGADDLDAQKLNKLADALAHLSYAESEGCLVLLGLREGCVNDTDTTAHRHATASGSHPGASAPPVASRLIALTDPIVHSAAKLPWTKGMPPTLFGRTNGGMRYLESWQRAHTCNEYCGLLSLPRPAPPSSSLDDGAATGTSDTVERPGRPHATTAGSVGGTRTPPRHKDVPVPKLTWLSESPSRSPEGDSDATQKLPLMLALRRMRENVPVRTLPSRPASTVTSPMKSRSLHATHDGRGMSLFTPASSVVNFAGGVMYCFDREGSARWQPSKVTVRLDLSEKPVTAPPSAASGKAPAFVCFRAKVRTEDATYDHEKGREEGGRSAPVGKDEQEKKRQLHRFVSMRVRVFALTVDSQHRGDEAYFAAAGERTLLAEVLAEYNSYLRHEKRGQVAQPLFCKPCAVIRINRNKIRATLAANPGADDGRSHNIIDFFSTDSRDLMLIAEPESDEAVALIEGNYVRTGGAAAATTQSTAVAAGFSSELTSAQVLSETRRVFQAFCKEDVGGGLVVIKDLALHAPSTAAAREESAQRGTTPKKGAGGHFAGGFEVSASLVAVNTVVASVSSLGDRVLFLSERLTQFHVYTALKYAFNFYKLKWQPVETFICVPNPHKGIGVGTFRVCFEVLELPRRRKAQQQRAEGYNIQREMALHSTRGRGVVHSSADDGAVSAGCGAPGGATWRSDRCGRVARDSACSHADEHDAFASPSMPRLDVGATPSTTPNVSYAGPLSSQTGTWTANVAKMFKRNSALAAGLPITERNYFFEAAKQNYCACVARDFNQKLAMRTTSRSGVITSCTPRDAVGPMTPGQPTSLMMTSRTMKHMNKPDGDSAASPRQRQYSTTATSAYPQLWFIPESVVTLRYDVDLPMHLCHARRGFFSYRCTEIKKRKTELFEEAGGLLSSPMNSMSLSESTELRSLAAPPRSMIPTVAAVRKTAAGGHATDHVQCMTFTLEPQLDGHFSKYTSNDERVFYTNEVPLSSRDDELRRQVVKCAEALAHYSWEESSGGLLVCDLQGVGTALTDPEIHTIDDGEEGENGDEAAALAQTYDDMIAMDGTVRDQDDSCRLFEQTALYLGGNGGRAGIDLFIHRHKCNEVCEAAGLPPLRESARTLVKSTSAGATTAAGFGTVTTRGQQLQQERPRNRYLLIHKGTQMAAQML